MIHLMTQNNQPFGSVRRCCERCGLAYPKDYTDDPAAYSVHAQRCCLPVRAWHIGEYGEVYAAHSEEEIKAYYIGLVGRQQADEDFESEFRELTDEEMRAEVTDADGVSWSWLSIAQTVNLPEQIGTLYN